MSDTSPFDFGRFVPGFDFLQNLAKGATAGVPATPPLSGWIAPTVSVQELDKRIAELKAVQFWLEQNARALTATVQALQVQRMTLATLDGMNVAMGDVASAFGKAAAPAEPATPAAAPAAKPAPRKSAPHAAAGAPPESAPESLAAAGMVDAMQWWNALTQQFQQIATKALQDAVPPPPAPAAKAPRKAPRKAPAKRAARK